MTTQFSSGYIWYLVSSSATLHKRALYFNTTPFMYRKIGNRTTKLSCIMLWEVAMSFDSTSKPASNRRPAVQSKHTSSLVDLLGDMAARYRNRIHYIVGRREFCGQRTWGSWNLLFHSSLPEWTPLTLITHTHIAITSELLRAEKCTRNSEDISKCIILYTLFEYFLHHHHHHHYHRPDDGGSTHLWNVGLHRDYMTLHPRRL
jgi:hypothetical protein